MTLERIGQQSVLANARTWCVSTIAVQAVGLIAANKNTGRAQNIPAIPIFFETRSVVPGHF
jgi:hypothetical protein